MILATSNLHKVGEMRELLPGIDLEPLPEGYESPVEDGDSFEANALIKARAAHAALGGAVIADDSGIEAFDLGGAPGIYSARYAGEGASDEDNLDKLLREVDAAGGERRAAYVCVDRPGRGGRHRARLRSQLRRGPAARAPRRGRLRLRPDLRPRRHGPDDGRTMAEISAAEKNAISHRGRAARLAAAHLAS